MSAKDRLQFSQQVQTSFDTKVREGQALGMTELNAYKYASNAIAMLWAGSREELETVHASGMNRLRREITLLKEKNARQVAMIERLEKR